MGTGDIKGGSPNQGDYELSTGKHATTVRPVDDDGSGLPAGTASDPTFTSEPSTVTLTKIADVAMTLADTQYSVVLPAGAKGVVLKLASTGAAWRLSPDAGEVAGGGGTQLAAGQAALIEGPLAGQTVYFAAAVAGQTMTILHE